MKLTLGVLLCDSVDPARLHIAGDYHEMFAELFRRHAPPEIEVTLRFYDVVAGEFPARFDECAGYLTNGAGASVYDPDPWIARLEEYLRTMAGAEVKLFAICFGHQMIAKALGGRVEKSERGWGLGVHRVTIDHHEPWMIPAADSFHIVKSHQDQVTELPPEAVVLASTPHCPVELFRCGSLVGIQGHPEFSIPYAQALMDSRAEVIPAETRNKATASFSHHPDRALLVSWILAFLGP